MSEVREGYKMTELGEIPIEWKVEKFRDLGTFKKGKGIAKKDLSDFGNQCILYGHLYTKYKEIIKKVDSFTNISPKNSVIGKVNDLLIPSSGETAIDIAISSALTVNNVLIGGDINLFTPSNEIDSRFLSYQINSIRKKDMAKLAQGSSVYHLYAPSLENFLLAIPSFREQQKIAEILSTVDTQIEQTEQMIEQTKELKHGLMQQLLTKGIGHKEFKNSEVGKIPLSWESKKIGDLCELKGRIGWRGYTKEDLRDSGPLVIGATQINSDNKLDFSKPTFLSEEKFKESPEIMVSFGDIIYVKTGNTIGKLALVDVKGIKATINPNTVLLKNISCNNNYIYYFLSQDVFKQKVISTITIGAQPSINQKTLNNLMVAIPPLEEQQKIAEILSSVDDQIDIYEKEKEKYEELKKGLMQQLLTGKIRVKVDE